MKILHELFGDPLKQAGKAKQTKPTADVYIPPQEPPSPATAERARESVGSAGAAQERKTNPFANIINFFKKRDTEPTEAGKKWFEGYNAFERGKKHYLAGDPDRSDPGRIQAALDCFDEAIASGFENGDGGIYGLRGSCLQVLNFHLDAIDDFDKAIPIEPEDCNLYFMRSVSKGETGDLRGRVADLQVAIRLAQTGNPLNERYNAWAKKLGYENIAAKFTNSDLVSANNAIGFQEAEDYLRPKYPGLDFGPDLVSRRRAKVRRRTQQEPSAD